jgi:hypothetical protein
MKAKLMRKLLFLFILALPVVAISQQPNRPAEFFIKPENQSAATVQTQIDSINIRWVAEYVGASKNSLATVDTVFNTASTALDTSRCYRTAPVMSVWYNTDDTAGSSVDVDVDFYVAVADEFNPHPKTPPPYDRFVLVKSLSITSETTGWWDLTDSAIPPGSWCFFIVDGDGSNGTTETKLRAAWFDENKE